MKLSPQEREVIVTYNDAEKVWRVYSDSATMRGTMLRLARQIGAEVHRVGDHALEFACAAGTLRLTAKRRIRLSPEQRAARASRLSRRPNTVGAEEGKVAILERAAGSHSDGA
jgi:hypothetical protein